MKPVTVPFFISHNGCPHTCVFCDQRAIAGADGSLPSAAQIVEKIEQWRSTAGERPLEVAFFGGTFTALPSVTQRELLMPLQVFREAGVLRAVRISTRPDAIDMQQMEILRTLGVATVELGVQSLDDSVLSASGRGHTAQDSLNAIRQLKDSGFVVGAQLMPGLPGDSPLLALDSLKQVIAAGVDFVRIYPVVVLRGTELARLFQAGIYQPLSLAQGIIIGKILLHYAMQKGVPVIRIGLQADQGLNEQSIVGGCWHPALGQLVRSALYADLLAEVVPDNSMVTIGCQSGRYSDVAGEKNSTLNLLAARGVTARITADGTLSTDQLTIETAGTRTMYSIITDLHYSIP